MRKPKQPEIKEETRGRLMRRLLERGYSDVTDFWRNTDIQVSHETVRRALHGGKPTSVESFIKIGAHLGLTNPELADLCHELGDTFWPKLLSDPKTDKIHKAIIGIVSKISSKDEKFWTFFKVNAAVCAAAAGVDISEDMASLCEETGSREPENDIQSLQMRSMQP